MKNLTELRDASPTHFTPSHCCSHPGTRSNALSTQTHTYLISLPRSCGGTSVIYPQPLRSGLQQTAVQRILFADGVIGGVGGSGWETLKTFILGFLGSVLGSGRHPKAFPELVGWILVEYEPQQSHKDLFTGFFMIFFRIGTKSSTTSVPRQNRFRAKTVLN